MARRRRATSISDKVACSRTRSKVRRLSVKMSALEIPRSMVAAANSPQELA
jgi:hypothetical protein